MAAMGACKRVMMQGWVREGEGGTGVCGPRREVGSFLTVGT